MYAAFVTFQYAGDFDEAKVRNIAEGSRAMFEGMPGLRSKTFTLRPEKEQALNVYLWETEAAAKAFFTDEVVSFVTGIYGVRPTVEFASVAALVDNGRR